MLAVTSLRPAQIACAQGQLSAATVLVGPKIFARTNYREQKARKARDKLDGLWSGGRAPFGLRVADDRTLEIDPDRRPVVELIFDLYVGRRLGVDRIRQELRRRGIESPNGRVTWSRNAVLNVLRQRAYVYDIHEATGVKSETFIPVETFERTQQLLRENARLRHAQSGESWPLSLMRCVACASTFGTESGGTRRRTYFDRGRYRGSSHFLRTGSGCKAVRRLPADFIEPLVLRRLIEVFRDPRAFRLAIEKEIRALKSGMSGDESEVAVMQSERDILQQSLKKLAISWVDGVLSDEEIDHKRRSISERLDAVEVRLIEIGPERLEDLERTHRLVAGLERWRQITEEREWRGLPMNSFNLLPSLAETDQLVEVRESNRVPVRMPGPDDVPHVLRT